MNKLYKSLNIERFQNFTVTNIDKNINELLLNSISVKNLYIFVYINIICDLNKVIHYYFKGFLYLQNIHKIDNRINKLKLSVNFYINEYLTYINL